MKAIIFDFDNTLIDRQKAFKEMLKIKISETIPNKDLLDDAINDILEWDDNGRVERNIVFKKYCDKYNVTCISSEELTAYWSNTSGTNVYLFDDVLEILNYLKDKYRLALLTNGHTVSQRRKLNASNLLNYFEISIVSDEIGISKPNKEAFLYICKELKLEPNECLYIGDNYEIDYLGALNAGLQAIYLDRLNKNLCENSITSLLELKQLL